MVENTGIRVFDADIENRVAFAESMTMGQNIFEWNADKKAMAVATFIFVHCLHFKFVNNPQIWVCSFMGYSRFFF
jgi:hypothetical protein